MGVLGRDENRRRITFAVETLRNRDAPEAERVAARKVLHDIGDEAATAQGAVGDWQVVAGTCQAAVDISSGLSNAETEGLLVLARRHLGGRQ